MGSYARMARPCQMCVTRYAQPVWAYTGRAYEGWLTVEARLSTGTRFTASPRMSGANVNLREPGVDMAVDGRINVRHEDVFPVPVLVLGVEPVNDFEKVKAKVPD